VRDGRDKDARAGADQADRGDGVLLARVFDGRIIPPVIPPEEEGVVDGGPRVADLREDAAEGGSL
jgi:hypothetical protein